jgi:hypothetical protein
MPDPAAQAFTAAGVYRAGVAVTFVRLSGYAPAVTTVASANVTAIVRTVVNDTTEVAETGYSASQPGSISQDDRLVIVMAQDLTAAGFPLPVLKGDQVVLPSTSETLEVTRVDPYLGALRGTVNVYVTGVS